MKDYNVLNELVPKTQELYRLIFDKGYEQGHADALNQQPCEDEVSRDCNKCAHYVDGANHEACDECFADEYEHPNFKPKAQHCDDCISKQAVDELSKELVHTTRDKADFLCNFWERLQKLPSVTLQSCDDVISRKAVLDKIYNIDGMEALENSNIFAKHYADMVKSLPPVTLKQQICEDVVSRQAVLEQAMDYGSNTYLIPVNSVKALPSVISEEKTRWIPVSERLPIEEFKQGRKEGWVYDLYPCLVTRTASYSRENPKRIYVAKHYFDGENFVNNGEEICNEVIAWMPLPKPYKAENEVKNESCN